MTPQTLVAGAVHPKSRVASGLCSLTDRPMHIVGPDHENGASKPTS